MMAARDRRADRSSYPPRVAIRIRLKPTRLKV
jgi:hypothetical protein